MAFKDLVEYTKLKAINTAVTLSTIGVVAVKLGKIKAQSIKKEYQNFVESRKGQN